MLSTYVTPSHGGYGVQIIWPCDANSIDYHSFATQIRDVALQEVEKHSLTMESSSNFKPLGLDFRPHFIVMFAP